jgi:REP element-mobilizing transposase RayT
MPDHMHLLTTLSREASLADSLRDLKALTSKWIHEEIGTADFSWQAGYGAFTVSGSALDSVRHYIATQEEHHRRMSYQQEFVAFLERHHVDFDTRYLWE